MSIIATTLGTDEPEHREPAGLLERFVRKIVPAANPDFESRYYAVRLWWIELDDVGVPQREIGLDSSGRPIVIGPFQENFGFWTDSSMTFSSSEWELVSPSEFDARWRSFQQSWVGAHSIPTVDVQHGA